ncbi:uncharacterized protein LOC120388693 isoform X1 [Mauremys reevesii]|uniref:uncharacterized protein LOC120388693 isoform X1 n=1 Tax=Mauremys reevesii TaxID=260615 RepID=UPI00193EEF6B|nr:uncharacterized protein LOC120388693 isoform X1 [Mauremys reevesii]
MEPWLEVVVVAAGSPGLGSDREGCSPARKRPRRSPPQTETPMEWEPPQPAGRDPPTWGTPSWPCSVSPGHWATDHWDPAHEWPKEPAGPRKLADESAPASGVPPRPAPHSSQSQPTARSDPGSSAPCPGTGDLARQRRKKPALSKSWKSMGNRGLAAIVPLVQGILSAFASGLRLAKLLELMRNQHGVDVETLCHAASAADVLGLLAQVPGLRVCTPERGPQCLIQLERASADESAPAPGGPLSPAPCSSQSQPAPRSDLGSSASFCPERGDLARQRPKKPARSKRRKSMGDRGVAVTLAPFLGHVLRPFPMGLGLPKLLEAVRRDHDLDLVALSREAGIGRRIRTSPRGPPQSSPMQQPVTASPALGSWVLCLLPPRNGGPGTPAAEEACSVKETEIHGRQRCGCHPRPLSVEYPAPLPPGPGAPQAAGGRAAGPGPGPGGAEPGSRVRRRAAAAGAGARDLATQVVERQHVHRAPPRRWAGGGDVCPSPFYTESVTLWIHPPAVGPPGSGSQQTQAGVGCSCLVFPRSWWRRVLRRRSDRMIPSALGPSFLLPWRWGVKRAGFSSKGILIPLLPENKNI